VGDCIYLQGSNKAHFLTRNNLEVWLSAEEVSTKRRTIQQFMETTMVNGLYIENLNLPELSFSTNLSQSEPQVRSTTHLFSEFAVHIPYFPAHKKHPDFCLTNFRKNDECISILVIYWKKTGLLRTKISDHNIIYSI
jgi:hypothetical protein